MDVRLAVLGAAALAITTIGPSGQSAAQPDHQAVRTDTGQWSAAKKRYVRPYAPRAYVYHAPRYYGRLGDPSLGPNGLPYQRPYDRGGCIIDEGYGRFTTCSNR
jgi:hypothetical protein